VCIYIYIYTHTYVWLLLRRHCIHPGVLWMCVYVYVFVYVCAHALLLSTIMQLFTTHTNTHACMHIHIHNAKSARAIHFARLIDHQHILHTNTHAYIPPSQPGLHSAPLNGQATSNGKHPTLAEVATAQSQHHPTQTHPHHYVSRVNYRIRCC
jgi:hypothetical protein